MGQKTYLYNYICMILFVIYGIQTASAVQMNNPPSQVILVIDEALEATFPRNFRSSLATVNQLSKNMVSQDGLSDLKFMSSGQFSERTLLVALKPIKEKVWLIDVRRESHGFINGIPISWYGEKNRTNLGLTNQEILKAEEKKLALLYENKTIVVNQILEKTMGNINKVKEMILDANLIESESQLAHRLGLGYLRIGVLDHHHPSNADVDEFVDFVKNLPADNWLYIHCRGGKGRSSTFVLMYDILKNGKKLSLDEISQRQTLLGSKDLFKIKEDKKTLWKKEAANARKNFIEKFYDYVKSNDGYPNLTWSQWLSKQ